MLELELKQEFSRESEQYSANGQYQYQDDYDRQQQEYEEERDAYASIYADDYNDPDNEINHNTNGNGLFVLSCVNNSQAPRTAGYANLSTPQIQQRHQERYSELQSLFSMPNNLTQHDIDVLNVSIIAEEYKQNKHLQRQQHMTEDQYVEQQVITKSISQHVQRLHRPAPQIGFNSTSPKRSTLTPRHRIHTNSIAREGDDDASQFSPDNSIASNAHKTPKKIHPAKTFKHSLLNQQKQGQGGPAGYNYGGYVPQDHQGAAGGGIGETSPHSPVLTVESFVHVAQRMKEDIKQLVQDTIRSELKNAKKSLAIPTTPGAESARVKTAGDFDNISINSNNITKRQQQSSTPRQSQQQQSLQNTIERKVSLKIAQLNEDLALLKSGKGIPSGHHHEQQRLHTADTQAQRSQNVSAAQ
eukprot:gene30763-38024_t